ncbi:RAMP superfamily CRISPR-associated protein [Methanosarcina siciliae]|nr:RAMP superfamily CRISPR-associated protein [Methanosarcina siciliae]
MGYTCFEIRFKAKSPIFIGSRKIGFIQQARRYIPGKTMWGALTANAARKLIDEGIKYNPKVYEEVGKCIERYVKNTYFFPEITDQENGNIQHTFNPIFTQEGLKYGKCSEREFESTFISSFVSTATVGNRNSAMDESLHETEYILNKVNCKTLDKINCGVMQVYWKGYLFVKEDISEKCSVKNSEKFEEIELGYENTSIKLFEALNEIHVGGDLRYGFGKLELRITEVKKIERTPVFDWFLESAEDRLIFNKDNGNKGVPIFGHLLLDSEKSIKYRGELEPLVGRMYDLKKGFGRYLSSNGVAFVPGTCFEEKINKIELGSFGLLKFANLE